ncbi:MAG TPA: FmdB family zinc ribbon protein [Candidatus Baltobacteraceae bacterium]|jgi:putative FmdB family regulatory protein
MPLYDYKCTKCGTVREVRHGFNESHDQPCPACGAAMTRVFNPAPIVFKGSGFYATDSRPKSDTKSDTNTDSKSDSKSESKSEAKPETKTEPSSGGGKSESAA